MNNNKIHNFRWDINGLRAYAVIIVVLFHFGIMGFSAGFIGVDLFFVISGFLMTGIITKDFEKNSFSLLKFYLSRAIRIIPALLFLIVILLILGWFFILAEDYELLAKHSLSSVLFYSNMVYLNESGYFDLSSNNKILLHTWSLSLEWQFYIIYPIILIILNKLKCGLMGCFVYLFLLFSLSLLFSVYYANSAPESAFYLFISRAWELIFGGLVYYFSKLNSDKKYNKLIEIIGILIVITSLYFFDSNYIWPNYYSILPVFACGLVIIANRQKSFWTNSKITQFIGDISYSVYLWHWPVVYFFHYYELFDFLILKFIGILVSILMGFLSFKYIEKLSKAFLGKLNLINAYAVWILSVTALSIFCFYILVNNGIKNRFNNEVHKIIEVAHDKNPRQEECMVYPGKPLKSCEYGNGELSLYVFGDSHANAMMKGIHDSLPINTKLKAWTVSGCTAVEGLKRTNNPRFKCGEHVTRILSEISKESIKVPLLIVSRSNSIFGGEPENEKGVKPVRYINRKYDEYNLAYKSEMQSAYVDTLCKFAVNHQVYVTRPTPESSYSIPPAYAKRTIQSFLTTEVTISRSDYNKRSADAWAAQDLAQKKCGIRIIDISKAFCDDQICSFVNNGRPLFMDDDHMSWQASQILIPYFKTIFEQP